MKTKTTPDSPQNPQEERMQDDKISVDEAAKAFAQIEDTADRRHQEGSTDRWMMAISSFGTLRRFFRHLKSNERIENAG